MRYNYYLSLSGFIGSVLYAVICYILFRVDNWLILSTFAVIFYFNFIVLTSKPTKMTVITSPHLRPDLWRRIPVKSVVIGNTRCIYNARSPFLRCSVNPKGPCESCRDFLLQETIYEN
jgi:hypothetical protein